MSHNSQIVKLYFIIQVFLTSSLPALLNHHVFKDHSGLLGGIVLEMGTAETYIVQRSRRQPSESICLMIFYYFQAIQAYLF